MLYYDRIDISKGIDPTESNRSKEWRLLMILDYCCIIHNISKFKAINILKNFVLEYIKNIA